MMLNKGPVRVKLGFIITSTQPRLAPPAHRTEGRDFKRIQMFKFAAIKTITSNIIHEEKSFAIWAKTGKC